MYVCPRNPKTTMGLIRGAVVVGGQGVSGQVKERVEMAARTGPDPNLRPLLLFPEVRRSAFQNSQRCVLCKELLLSGQQNGWVCAGLVSWPCFCSAPSRIRGCKKNQAAGGWLHGPCLCCPGCVPRSFDY